MLEKNRLNLSSFWQWWRQELGEVFFPLPPVGASQHSRRIIISVEPARVQALQETSAGTRAIASYDSASDTDMDAVSAIAERVIEVRPRAPIGVRFDADSCLHRKIDLPRAAQADLEQILQLELERSTPFSRGDIYSAHYVSNTASPASAQVTAHHLILKRSKIDPLLETFSHKGIRPAFVDCWNSQRSAQLPVDFLEPRHRIRANRSRRMKMAAAIGALSAIMLAAATVTIILRHQSALKMVEKETAELSNKARDVRLAIEEFQATERRIAFLSSLKRERMAAAKVLETVTTLLPDTVWLTEFHIEDRKLDISGYAGTAASLISRFESAPNFERATLSAPVVLDPREDRERFSLRASLKTIALRSQQEQPDTNTLENE